MCIFIILTETKSELYSASLFVFYVMKTVHFLCL